MDLGFPSVAKLKHRFWYEGRLVLARSPLLPDAAMAQQTPCIH